MLHGIFLEVIVTVLFCVKINPGVRPESRVKESDLSVPRPWSALKRILERR